MKAFLQKTYIFSFLFFIGILSYSQSTNENYIKKTEYLTENGESGSKIQSVTYYDGIGREIQEVFIKGSSNNRDIVIHHSYDPLTGRKTKDFLPVPTQQYTGNLVSDAEQMISDYYDEHYDDPVYYFEKKLDVQSMNSRIQKQAFPGTQWRLSGDHTVKYIYETNGANEVRRYAGMNSNLSELGYYNAGELKKNIVQDENNETNSRSRSTEIFKDKMGRTILTRKYATEGSGNMAVAYDTYYVYDLQDNLVYIIPPLVNTSDGISENEKLLITQYIYDSKNRVIEKKIPDQGTQFIVYDKQDRIVATKDAKQVEDNNNQWTFYKYDKFGRLVMSGLVWDSGNRTQVQNAVNNNFGSNDAEFNATGFTHDGITIYYKSDKGYPATGYHILTVNYYDKYSGLVQAEVTKPTTVEGQTVRSDANNTANSLKGLPTSSTTRIMGNHLWEHVYTFYDVKSRPVRSHKTFKLPSGEKGYTKIDSKLEAFRGKTTFNKTYHKRGSLAETIIQDNFTYDHQERPASHTQSLNGSYPERISSNIYDLLGRLSFKDVGNKINQRALQRVNFSYNIRGWLTGINDITQTLQLRGVDPGEPMDDIFAMSLHYNHLLYEGNSTGYPQFNGNISKLLWKTASDNTTRGYIYKYDDINRMREARYHRPGAGTPFPGNFDENLTYDKNGNILTLQRYAGFDFPFPSERADNLTYTYGTGTGQYFTNKLSKVVDGENDPKGFNNGASGTNTDYTYDANGNMTSDLNKGITSIEYNYMNLPVKIKWNNSETKKIEYLYNAAGVKIQKKVTMGTAVHTTDYLDGFQYYGSASSPTTLQFFPHAEGYVRQTTVNGQMTFDYVYNYTDHLGNVRLSYALDPDTGELEILNENHYYPFGLRHQKYTTAVPKDVLSNANQTDKALQDVDPSNPVLNIYSNYDYKYNYREWQDEYALNWYSMDFRNYDPAIARFHNADPLGELTPDWTPYRFAFNNPVFFNDPTGLNEEDPFFQWDGHNGEHSDFWNIMNGNWDVNWDALATGDWSQEDMYDNFGGEGYDFDGDFSNIEPGNEAPDCGPCVFVPALAFFLFGGGTTRNSTGNPDVDHAAIDKSIALQRDAMLMASPMPALKIPFGVSFGFGKVSMNSSKFVKLSYATENIAGFYIRGSKSVANGTYTRTIQSLANTGNKNLFDLFKVFETEARAAGVNKIIINGIDIVETRLINEGGARLLGYTFKQTSNSSIQLTKIL